MDVRDDESPMLPSAMCGVDMRVLTSLMRPQISKVMNALLDGEEGVELDETAMAADLKRGTWTPDETLS